MCKCTEHFKLGHISFYFFYFQSYTQQQRIRRQQQQQQQFMLFFLSHEKLKLANVVREHIQYFRTTGKRERENIIFALSILFDWATKIYYYFVKFEHCVLFVPFLHDSVVKIESNKTHVIIILWNERERKFFLEFDFVKFYFWIKKKKLKWSGSMRLIPLYRNTRDSDWFKVQVNKFYTQKNGIPNKNICRCYPYIIIIDE